jgi:hypothetical protein
MADRTRIESRLHTILDAARDRRSVSRWLAAVTVLSAGSAALSLAMLHAADEKQADAGIGKTTVEAGRVLIKGKIDTLHDLVVRIDRNEKPIEWRTRGDGGGFVVVVEASDKIPLEGGKTGHGFVVSVKQRGSEAVTNVTLTEGDPVVGTFAIRRETDFVTKDGIVTFADVTLKDGKKLAVSLGLADLLSTRSGEAQQQGATQQGIRHFPTGASVGTIACSADGKLIAVANDGPTVNMLEGGKRTVVDNWMPSVEILNAETGKTVVSLKLTTADEDTVLAQTERVPDFEVRALAFSPDGNVLAVGTTVGQVKLFHVRTGE